MDREQSLIYLAACAVNKKKPDPAILGHPDLDALLELAIFHQMAGLTAYSLEAAGISDKRFITEKAKAVFLEITYDKERQIVLEKLEEAGIWHMPLKGVILKEDYPQPGMRQMSDNDILIDRERAGDVKEIMEGLGFETYHLGERYRDDYRKPPVLHFEMHRDLFEPEFPGEAFDRYFENIKDRLLPDEEKSFRYHLTREDFYLYMICHEYKHIAWGGIGLRALLDTYVYQKKYAKSMDWDYISGELKKLGIQEYEKKNRRLAAKVFSKGDISALTKDEKDMLTYFITSGVHGTMDHSIQNMARSLGIRRYVFSRILLPMDQVEERYPFFYKHKALLPFLPLYRLIRHTKNAAAEVQALLRKNKK